MRSPRPRGKASRILAALLLPVLAGACAVGPNYQRPQTPPAAAGAFQTVVPGTSTAEPTDRWWRLYDDPVLDRLVERALVANTDLRAARANLLRAQAALRETRSALLPSGDVTGGANYGNNQGGGSGGNFQQGGGKTQWSYNGSVTADWEIDLFGRISRSIEAARGDAGAVEATRDRVALTVAAETARSYVDACALAQSIAVAKESAALAERELTIQRAREQAGAGMQLDTERSATALANVRATLPTLEGQRRASLFELAALLGATPAEIPEEASNCAKAPAPAVAIPVGDGRGLLARRPDVREAERKLAAETARIGVATAELYPSISLGGSGNFFRNDQVRGSDSWSFSLGPFISWNWGALFAGRAHVQQAEASAQAALATFDGTVLTALKEVEQALSRYAAEGERNARLREAATHADTAYRLADQRYRAGSIAFLDLLQAQNDLLTARGALANSDQQLGSLRVDLFKALGGGWSDPLPPAAPAPS
jgi:NodT family efflux transporter outer membrane factor (OMF) lipoprotein